MLWLVLPRQQQRTQMMVAIGKQVYQRKKEQEAYEGIDEEGALTEAEALVSKAAAKSPAVPKRKRLT